MELAALLILQTSNGRMNFKYLENICQNRENIINFNKVNREIAAFMLFQEALKRSKILDVNLDKETISLLSDNFTGSR